MAKQALSEITQRWVVQPTDEGSFTMLEAANDMGDSEEGRRAYWITHGYANATLATVRITTTIEPDDPPTVVEKWDGPPGELCTECGNPPDTNRAGCLTCLRGPAVTRRA